MNLNKTLFGIFWIQVGILLTLIFITEGVTGGADAICHWLISKDSVNRPILFLDQWNKPIFTLLSAPFAQFGLIGMRIFSGLTVVGTALLISSTSLGNRENSPLSGILFMLVPQLVLLSTSSMTEPLFCMFFGWLIYLLSKEKWNWAALAAGLAPFVRQEGILILVVMLVILIAYRKYRHIPKLLAGTAIFALIGAVATQDVIWIISSFPYRSDSSSVYGSGDLLHYLSFTEEIFGYPIAVAAVLGLGYLLISTAKKPALPNGPDLAKWFAALISVGFFLAHSVAWWKGASGSLGLIRVMACIAPGVAFLAAGGILSVTQKWGPSNFFSRSLVLLFILGCFYQVVHITNLPVPFSKAERSMQKAGHWLKENPSENTVHYADPMLYHFASEHANLVTPINRPPLTLKMITDLPAGDRIVWDAHFSQSAGRLPLDSMLLHPKLKRIRSFSPESSISVYSGGTYQIMVFEVSDKAVNKEFREVIRAQENFDTGTSSDPILLGSGVNGSACSVANEKHQYVTLRETLTRDWALTNPHLTASVQVYVEAETGADFAFAASVAKDGKTYLHSSSNSKTVNLNYGAWTELTLGFKIPDDVPPTFELRCYISNPNEENVLVDNLSLRYQEVRELP